MKQIGLWKIRSEDMSTSKANYKGLRIRVCKKCKKPIDERQLYDYCPDCFKKVEEIFEKIAEYLREYPGATAFEIEQELKIPYHVIQNFIKEERLIEIPNEYLNVECLGCGRLLLSAHHRYCPDCRNKLQKEAEAAGADLQSRMSSQKAKMHIAGILRKGK